jgi:uncharacterized membrane protein YphA (DoxX/SURF4 family)
MRVKHEQPDSWLSKKMPFLVLAWALVLGGFLIVSALSKAVNQSDTFSHLKLFARVVGFDRPVPWFTSSLFVSLVLAEIALGAVLVSGYWTRVAMLLAFTLMCVFSGWLVYANISGFKSSCGCGLAVTDAGLGWNLARNGVIGLFCLACTRLTNQTTRQKDDVPRAESASRIAHS